MPSFGTIRYSPGGAACTGVTNPLSICLYMISAPLMHDDRHILLVAGAPVH
jgi:hypothetical protein